MIKYVLQICTGSIACYFALGKPKAGNYDIIYEQTHKKHTIVIYTKL